MFLFLRDSQVGREPDTVGWTGEILKRNAMTTLHRRKNAGNPQRKRYGGNSHFFCSKVGEDIVELFCL